MDIFDMQKMYTKFLLVFDQIFSRKRKGGIKITLIIVQNRVKELFCYFILCCLFFENFIQSSKKSYNPVVLVIIIENKKRKYRNQFPQSYLTTRICPLKSCPSIKTSLKGLKCSYSIVNETTFMKIQNYFIYNICLTFNTRVAQEVEVCGRCFIKKRCS